MSTNETERDDATTDSNAPAAAPETSAEPKGEVDSTASASPAEAPSDVVSAEPAAAPAPSVLETKPVTDGVAPAAEKKSGAAVATPGQRIAAQKAAKAAQKAAEKSRRAEEAAAAATTDGESSDDPSSVPSVPDEIELRAAEVRSVFEKNTNNLAKLGVALLAGVIIFAGVSALLQHRERSAGTLLVRAVDASRAQIGTNQGQTDGRLRFGSESARDRETLSRYRKLVSEYPSSDAARYGHLGIARILMAQAKYAEAQTEIRAASSGLSDEPALEALAVEASALAFTGEQKYAEAQRSIDRLGQLDRRRYRDVADYLAARVLFDRGDRNGAKEKLRGLLDRLDDEGATPVDHVEDQARNLMRLIDPSAVPAESPSQLSPELLQMLLQQQGLGGGAP